MGELIESPLRKKIARWRGKGACESEAIKDDSRKRRLLCTTMIHHKAVNVYFSDEKKAKIRSIIGPNGLLVSIFLNVFVLIPIFHHNTSLAQVEESKKNEVSTILGCDLKVPRHLLPGETAVSILSSCNLQYDRNEFRLQLWNPHFRKKNRLKYVVNQFINAIQK